MKARKPPPPPTPTGLLWGAGIDGDVYAIGQADAPYSEATWDTFEAHAGGKVQILHFSNPWLRWDGYGTAASKASARGALPLITVHGPAAVIGDVNGGAYDATIDVWAQAAAAYGLPVYFRPWPEMNGGWEVYAASKVGAANYVKAFNRLQTRVQAVASNVLFVWCPNVAYPGSTPFADVYPGNPDLLGLDGYNWGTNPLKPDRWRSFDEVFATSLQQLATLAPGKPVWICETASTEIGGDKAAWITDMWASFKSGRYPNLQALVWFDWPIPQGTGRMDWPIESSPAAQAAFAGGRPA